jgi:hypothetical protein
MGYYYGSCETSQSGKYRDGAGYLLGWAVAWLILTPFASALEVSPEEPKVTLTATVGPIGEHAENVDMAGGRFIVGGANFEARIYAQSNGTWYQEASLMPWDGIGSIFGYSVAISTDVAVASNPWVNSEDGAMYVFKHEAGNWVPDVKLQPPSGTDNTWFGTQVTVDGDWIASGAPRAWAWNRSVPGSTYLYHRVAGVWQEHAVLNSPESIRGDYFGAAVDISGDRMIIGASHENGVGAAYIYELEADEWVFRTKLLSPEASATGNFGAQVAIDGNTALIGDALSDEAFVFDFDGSSWTHALTVEPFSDDNGNVHRTLDVDGNVIVIGDPNRRRDPNAAIASVYLRSQDGWELYDQLNAPILRDGTFGLSVNVEGNSLVVTSYGDEGRAYVYSVTRPIPEPNSAILLAGVLALSGLCGRRAWRGRASSCG